MSPQSRTSIDAQARPAYRAYLLDAKNRIHSASVIEAGDDAEALAAARRLVNSHPVELWDRARLIAHLEAETPGSR